MVPGRMLKVKEISHGIWAYKIRKMCGVRWMIVAKNRDKFKRIGKAFIQQLMANGCSYEY